MPERAGLADVLSGKRVVICAGPGGVGKTTTAAALALGMAGRGLRVAVVTIDPARRLADALGLERLEDVPHRVDDALLPAGATVAGGELWAMTLDSKRTFDALIERLAPDERTRDEVLSNPIYRELSSAVAGSQEFTAIAKLHELDAEGDYDLVVLDTPPSRNALDFLEAPNRLIAFFQGRAVRLFLKPAGIGSRLLGAGTGALFSIMQKATGVDLLEDLGRFFRSLSGLVDGFTERARHVEALLGDPATAFLVVSSPEPGPVEEAAFLAGRLRAAELPFAALVVNRVRTSDGGPSEVPEALETELGAELSARVQRSAREAEAAAAADAAAVDALAERTGAPAVFRVEELPGDVHDLAGLAEVARRLLPAGPATRSS